MKNGELRNQSPNVETIPAKLMSGEVDRPFVGSRVASFSVRMV